MARRRSLLGSQLVLSILPICISAALRLVSWTLRIEHIDTAALSAAWRDDRRVLMTFWHNRIIVMPMVYRGCGVCILNSQSRDGEIATRALARWGIDSVRGSATRGGASGFLQLVRAARRGRDLALVPDGPRGPRYEAKPGVIHLARATGIPLFPVSYAASRFVQLGSWDRLIIPLPFARVAFVAGEPVHVARDADDATVEQHRRDLEERLNAVTRRAEELVGMRPA